MSQLVRQESIGLDIRGSGLIKSINESISKLGFGDLDTEDKLNNLLMKINTAGIDYSRFTRTYNEAEVYTAINEYIMTSLAFTTTYGDNITVSRLKHDGSADVPLRLRMGTVLGRGTYNTVFNATNLDDVSQRFAVKVSHSLDDKNELIEGFMELFIHAILVVYQRREQNLHKNSLIASLDLVSYNRTTKKFYTIMPKLDGTLADHIRKVSREQAPTEINKALMQLSCSLNALQKDLQFNHGDCKPDNIFYVRESERKLRYCLADFGFARIKIGDYVLQGQIFDDELGKFCGQFGKRHDIALLLCYLFRHIYTGKITDRASERLKYLDYINKFKYADAFRVASSVISSRLTRFDEPMFTFYIEQIYSNTTNGRDNNLNNDIFNIYEPNEMAKFLVDEFELTYDECLSTLGDNTYSYMDLPRPSALLPEGEGAVDSAIMTGGGRFGLMHRKCKFGL